MDIEIRPLDKVLVDGEAICLGMEQSAVEAAIGKGILVGKRYYYFNDEMAIDYNDNKVEFVGGMNHVIVVTERIVLFIVCYADKMCSKERWA